MNVDELLNADRALTAEEHAFLERETLALARELEDIMRRLSETVKEHDPVFAREMMRPARRMVKALEEATALPFE